MPDLLERALRARRASRHVAFRNSSDPLRDLIRDVAAMANSGGGVILFDGQPAGIDRIRIEADFADYRLVDATKDSRPVTALVVGSSTTLVAFDDKIYFRHGGRSEPATAGDVAKMFERREKELRKSWLNAVKRAVEAPASILPPEIRDSESPDATPIRIVDDPRAPAFRVVDYDKTHPYRQKEILATLHERLPSVRVNQFDLLSVRHVYNTDANADFSHKPMFGSRQYSQKFVDWLVESTKTNPHFFEEARQRYRGTSNVGPALQPDRTD